LDELERYHGHGLLIPKDFRAPGPFIVFDIGFKGSRVAVLGVE